MCANTVQAHCAQWVALPSHKYSTILRQLSKDITSSRLYFRHIGTSCNRPWFLYCKYLLVLLIHYFFSHTSVSWWYTWCTNTVGNLELSLNAKTCHHCRSFDLIRRLSPVHSSFVLARSTTENVSWLVQKTNNKCIEKINAKILFYPNICRFTVDN